MLQFVKRVLYEPRLRSVARWVVPSLVIALAAFLRFFNLGYPGKLVFDETYYVKDAWTMFRKGTEQSWPKDANTLFEAGKVDTFLNDPSYVVHPPLGKWIISLGMQLFGGGSSFGWRFSTALLGTLSVALIIVIARIIFKSGVWASIAGFMLAIDGHAIVLSRTAILDSILAFFALLAFLFLLLDRERARTDLAIRFAGRLGRGTSLFPIVVWRRPWLIAMGVALGAATAVKWSGLYFAAAFCIFIVLSDIRFRREIDQPKWLAAGLAQAVVNFILIVPILVVTYIASWSGWITTDTGYNRFWAEEAANRATGLLSFVPTWLQSLWHYHQDAYNFHVGLRSPHSYASNPLTWLFQLRPTSFFYEGTNGAEANCGSVDGCSSAITALGNPFIWWPAALALVYLTIRFITRHDSIAGLILIGIAGGYLPWLLYLNRTVFQFYSIAFLPWMILGLTYLMLLFVRRGWGSNRRTASVLVGVFLAFISLMSAFFYPIWIGTWVPYWFWHIHMWLPSWI